MARGVRLGFDERRNQRLLAWTILVMFLLGLLAFIVKGADQPADPSLKPTVGAAPAVALTTVPLATVPPRLTTVPPATVPPTRTPVPGFGEATFRVATGPELCALLARTQQQQARGLMQRTDLAGHVGMLFAFITDTNETFYMRNTPMPLSIAWFDSAGHFVSATDMDPCPDRPDCPIYAAARAYRYALEVPQGGLSSLGIGPGSTISVVGATC